MRLLFIPLAIALLAAACGGETAMVERLAGSAPPQAVATAAPTPTPEPPPPPSLSSLVLGGDLAVEDLDPDVVVEPLPGAAGREPRLRIELRHRVGGSSQPDAVVVFFNVPAKPGAYPLHSPEDPPTAGRVYAFVTTRGEAVGSMKDFNTAVVGSLTLRRQDEALLGSFKLSAQEPPPAPPPKPLPGQPPPRPVVGTIPPVPPAHVEARGTVLALPAPPGAPASASAAPVGQAAAAPAAARPAADGKSATAAAVPPARPGR